MPIRWGVAVASVALSAFATLWLRATFQPMPNALFFCAIIFSAWFGGVGPGILAGVLSVLAIRYFCTPPLHSWTVSVSDMPRYVIFLVSAVVISWISGQQKQAQRALCKARDELERSVQARTDELQKANRELQAEIAERRRGETVLRRIEDYLSEGQRLSHTGSWAWNVRTRENLYWSKEHFRIFGFDPATSCGDFKTARQRIHPEDQPKFDGALDRAVRERADFELNYRIILPGNLVRHLHTLGHPVFNEANELVEFIGTVMDVTERLLSDALLAAEKHTLEMIASGAPLRAVLTDLCNAVDEQSPGSFSGVLALDADGQKLWPMAGPRIPKAWTRRITPLAVGPCMGSCGTAVHRRETVVVSDIGTDPLWWGEFREAALSHGLRACWSKPVISTTGCVLGTLAMYYGQVRSPEPRELLLIERATHLAQIAFERHRTQESLRKAQANLAHATRVTTMGELTASIAHEVNQPLTAIVNNANASLGLLAAGGQNLEEVRQALLDIVSDAERAGTVIARVRALAKKSPLKTAVQDPCNIIADVLTLTRNESTARHITIGTELSEALPQVMADPVQIQQVLLNLVVNAMDAMAEAPPEKRLLMIRARSDTWKNHRAVTVSVQDSGPGLKAGQVERLFEPFYTTKAQGLGLGLAISRSIIEAHCGRLWAESADGSGATFLFTLPAAA